MLIAHLLHAQIVVWASREETSCLQFIGCAFQYGIGNCTSLQKATLEHSMTR